MTTSEDPAAQKDHAAQDSHLVPRAYLRAWTDDRGAACVHPVKPPPGAPADATPQPQEQGVAGIAVRELLLAGERPDGETFHDVDWSVAQDEDAIAPVLRRIRELWPLSRENKAAVAELIALQVVRGPREFARLDAIVEAELEVFAQFTDHPPGDGVVDGRLTEEALQQLREDMTGSTHRMTRMLKHARMGTSIIGSMQWSLVEFDEPVLATSDHPVHLWPLDQRSLRPQATATPGFRETLEVKWPLAPSLALLATWQDVGDDPEPLTGTEPLAASLNTCVIAQAEEQWLHRPDVRPPRRQPSELLNPWSRHLFAAYNERAANRSARRQQVAEILRPLLGSRTPESAAKIAFIAPRPS
jgi:hypothetical protein